MPDIEVSIPSGRSIQLCYAGPDEGDAVLYFHSPATAGEELVDAAAAADELRLRVLCVKRPSIDCSDVTEFVGAVGEEVAAITEALELRNLAILGWSGGAPYALAASERLSTEVASIHLVSPIPGPLTGPDALPEQTDRLRQVASTNDSSSWVTGPATLRDYQAVSAPWTFDVASITQPVTLWSPTEDEIVPPDLVAHLSDKLPNSNTRPVDGRHDWLTQNWGTVLSNIRNQPTHRHGRHRTRRRRGAERHPLENGTYGLTSDDTPGHYLLSMHRQLQRSNTCSCRRGECNP